MRSGMFDKRIIIQYRVYSRSTIGEETVTWTTEDTVWAQVRPVGANKREYLSMQKIQSDVTHMVTIRHRNGLNPNKRFLYGNRVLNIQNIVNPLERNEVLVCYCREELVT